MEIVLALVPALGVLVVPVVCALKGKRRLAACGLTGLTIIGGVAAWATVYADRSKDEQCQEDLCLWGLVIVAVVVVTAPVWATLLLAALTGAIRLAKPGSWWARTYYQGELLTRCEERAEMRAARRNGRKGSDAHALSGAPEGRPRAF